MAQWRNQADHFFVLLFRTMAAPGIYFVTSPILAIIGLFLFAAFMVYLVVPIAAWAGLYFNDFQRDKKKRDKLKIQAREAFDALAEEHRHGLVWTDLQEWLQCSQGTWDAFIHVCQSVGAFCCRFCLCNSAVHATNLDASQDLTV